MLAIELTRSEISAADRRRVSCIRPVQQAARPVAFGLIDTFQDLEAHAAEWTALQQRAGGDSSAFHSFGFVAAWAKIWLHDADGTPSRCRRLAILTARQNGRLVMVWPLVVERQLGLKIVSWLGQPVAQYGDVLLDDVSDPDGLIEEGWLEIERRLSPDVVRLRKVREDAVITPFLVRLGLSPVCRREAPATRLRAGRDDGQSFEHDLSTKARKNRRRLMRRLEEAGEVRFLQLQGDAKACEVALHGLAQKRRWLRQKGLYSTAFRGPRLDRFVADVIGSQPAAAGARVYALMVDGRPAAVALGFVSAGRLALHTISYAGAFEKAGAGVLNLEAVLRAAEEEGLTAVDFLAPNADYKMAWADIVVPVCDYVASITLRGRIATTLYDIGLQPCAKWFAEKVGPAAVQLQRGVCRASGLQRLRGRALGCSPK